MAQRVMIPKTGPKQGSPPGAPARPRHAAYGTADACVFLDFAISNQEFLSSKRRSCGALRRLTRVVTRLECRNHRHRTIRMWMTLCTRDTHRRGSCTGRTGPTTGMPTALTRHELDNLELVRALSPRCIEQPDFERVRRVGPHARHKVRVVADGAVVPRHGPKPQHVILRGSIAPQRIDLHSETRRGQRDLDAADALVRPQIREAEAWSGAKPELKGDAGAYLLGDPAVLVGSV